MRRRLPRLLAERAFLHLPPALDAEGQVRMIFLSISPQPVAQTQFWGCSYLQGYLLETVWACLFGPTGPSVRTLKLPVSLSLSSPPFFWLWSPLRRAELA